MGTSKDTFKALTEPVQKDCDTCAHLLTFGSGGGFCGFRFRNREAEDCEQKDDKGKRFRQHWEWNGEK